MLVLANSQFHLLTAGIGRKTTYYCSTSFPPNTYFIWLGWSDHMHTHVKHSGHSGCWAGVCVTHGLLCCVSG